MAYLIVGGGGFLGANLVAALQENNDFTKLFILDPCFKLSQYTHLKINESNITWINGSFLDSDLLDEILPGIETVFHLSSIGHTGRFGASKHRDYVRFFNVTGTERLIEKCRIHHVKRFIYASSIAVCFVGKPIYDFSESDTLPPKEEYLDIYSETKADAEKIVRNSSTFEFRTTCLRFRAIYGPQDVCVAQKVVEMVRRNFLMFKISKDGRETISNMSSGQNCGVSMHLANQALMKNDIHGQVYNITDGLKIGQYTVWNALIFALGKSPPKLFVSYDLVSFFVSVMGFICFELFGCSPPLTRFELEVLVTDNTYSIEKAQKELGFNPEKDNFKQTVEFYRKQTDQMKNRIEILCKTFYVPINSYIECAKFCLYMNFQYVGFQICLASINFIFSVALVMTIKQIRFGNIKANLRLILSLKGLLLFITCICSFSVELAAPPMLHIFWIYNSALVHIHLSLEVLVSLFSIWYAHRLEKVNILKIRVSMIDTLRTFSPSNMIYLAPPVGREIVVCPEKQAVLEEGLSQEEIVLNELGNFFNRALAAHHERYPLISFRPPIRFEDYE